MKVVQFQQVPAPFRCPQANPPVSDFSWVHKSGGPVASVAEAGAWRVAGQGDTLHLRGVTEQDTGTYILR